jgi:hypothetical protein
MLKLTRVSGETIRIAAKEILFISQCGSGTEIGFIGGGSALVMEDHDTVHDMKLKVEGRSK